jgi:hypothetical protein
LTRWLAVVGLVLGISLVGYAVFARETDEEKIHGLLMRLEKAVSVDGNTAKNPLFRAGQLRRDFADLFDRNVSYDVPELSTPSAGSESLVALAARSSMSLTTLDVSFSNIDVQIVPPGTRATTSTIAKIQAFRGTDPYEQSERRVRFVLTKQNGDWRITSFTVSSSRD